MKISRSTKNNLLRGAGSILEILPPRRQYSGFKKYFYKPAVSDSNALRRDWGKIGESLKLAMEKA